MICHREYEIQAICFLIKENVLELSDDSLYGYKSLAGWRTHILNRIKLSTYKIINRVNKVITKYHLLDT